MFVETTLSTGNHISRGLSNSKRISFWISPHCVANILQEFVRDVSTKLMDYLNITLVQQITPGNVDFGPSFTQIAIAKSLVISPAVCHLY